MGVDVIDVILCVQRIATTLSHTFLLPTRTWDLGVILTKRISITDQNMGFGGDFDKTR